MNMDSKSSNYSEWQEESLQHWAQIYITVLRMDWDEWIKLRASERHLKMYNPSDPDAPHIYGNTCCYCKHYRHPIDRCAECPVHDEVSLEEGTCCCEWEYVMKALEYDNDRNKAIEAVEDMIRHLQRMEDKD